MAKLSPPLSTRTPNPRIPKSIDLTYTAMLLSLFSGISLAAVLVAGTRLADATNVVVDDSNTARITYSTGWKDFIDLVMPTKGSAYNETFHPWVWWHHMLTWHWQAGFSMTADGDTDAFFTFNFTGSCFCINSFTTLRSHHSLARITGTSVEVRYIATDIIRTSFVTNTNVSYSIDGVPCGTAVRNPTNRTSYVYDQSLLSVTDLTNVEHTLSVYLSPPSVLLV